MDANGSSVISVAAERARLEVLARPLLELVQRITGVETTFISEIDWVAQEQHIVFVRNTGDLQVPEGTTVPWSDAMCRRVFLSGQPQSVDVAADFPGSIGADLLGMRSIFAVPIVDDDATIGTICGASRRVVPLGVDKLEMMLLISEAFSQVVKHDVESRADRESAGEALRVAEARLVELTTVAQAMESLALVDTLTDLANRRGFTARWEAALADSGHQGHPIALLVLDVDSFKATNDAHGHSGGDRALQLMGEVLRSVARASDLPARLGGDEFALALPHADAAGATAVAERIRVQFSEATTAAGVTCTVSIGVSTSADTPRAGLMAAADRALYEAKHTGRDRVCSGADDGRATPDPSAEMPAARFAG